MNELELIERKELRSEFYDRLDVLDRVKALVFFDKTQICTTEQVAEYFEVSKGTMDSLVKDNKEELVENGMVVLKGVDLKDFKSSIGNPSHLNRVANLNIFNKQSILKIAFLLTESDVALKIRNILSKENPELYSELSNKDNQLRFKKYEMEIKNYLEFSFGKENVKSQVKVDKYFVDFVLFDNVYVEVDENGHSRYNEIKELRREFELSDNDNNFVIRYNPHKQKPYELIESILLANKIMWNTM